jgi:hypothetical protein
VKQREPLVHRNQAFSIVAQIGDGKNQLEDFTNRMKFPPSTRNYPEEADAASKVVVSSLVPALKTLSPYPEDNTHCQAAIERLQNDLEIFLSKYYELILHVEKNRLLFAGEMMRQEEDRDGDLAYALFRDGSDFISREKT